MNNQIEKSQDFILSELETGDVACVGVITGGNATISRMAAIGFSPGATVNMVQNYNWCQDARHVYAKRNMIK